MFRAPPLPWCSLSWAAQARTQPIAPPLDAHACHAQDNAERINSMDFHRVEDLLITASDDDSIRVYNTASGALMETLYSKKYGCSNITMTHASSCALYATRKVPRAPAACPLLSTPVLPLLPEHC